MADHQEPTPATKGAPQSEFERAGNEQQPSLLKDVFLLISENKKWWLIPIVVVFVVFGIFAILGATGAAPFIYTLF